MTLKPPVLIPRPETEQLVELILSHYKGPQKFIEVGVGSGAICLSLLHERPNWRAVGIDISPEAVALTRLNAQALGVSDRLELHVGDLRQITLPQQQTITTPTNNNSEEGAFDFVVSNPPYIPSARLAELEPEVRCFEDPRALDGGEDGLQLITALVLRSVNHWLKPSHQSPEGKNASEEEARVWLEVDLIHLAGPLQEWARGQPGVKFLGTFPDFTGRERFCCLSKKTVGVSC